jgi:polysaccharide export outer membrane protein
MTPGDFAASLEEAYGARYLRNPEVTIALKSTRSMTVSVEGDVEQPGVYEIQPGQSLLSAIAMARSPSKTAKLDQVLIFRQINGQRAGARFDLTDIRSGKAADPQILPGDVVVVGFSAVRGAYRDLLQAAPLLNVFTQF